MSKTEYAYTTGTVGTTTKVYNYTYGNTWNDQLTAFDGTAITYDAAGNPTSFRIYIFGIGLKIPLKDIQLICSNNF